MDTNNNSSVKMEQNQQEQDPQQPQQTQDSVDLQLDQLSDQSTTRAVRSESYEEEQNPDRIELYVRYDASDTLRDESGTQTPIEDEPQGAKEGSAVTPSNDSQTANCNTPSNEGLANQKTMVIRVQESEEEDSESIELELESDNSLLLTSLTSLFPDATGLKFRHPETNTLRGVKLVDGKFTEPIDGWSSVKNYICVFNRGSKRRPEDDNDVGKKARTENSLDAGSDLVVLGLPWTTTEDTMRSYFEQYGEVNMVQIKTDPKTGKSRGFGFVRFAKSSIQNKLLSMRHFIDGRWCDIKVPLSKADADASKAAQLSRKIFVGRLPDNITEQDLKTHFSEFGTLTDVFIPKPFRNFAFVTFGTSDMAQSIFKHKHVIKGASVQISEAMPREPANNYGGGGGGSYNNGPQSNVGGYGPGSGYVGTATNTIHPFNSSYGAHQAPYHHHGKNNSVGNFSGNAYQNNRKMHQQSAYYQMPSYGGSSGPSSSLDSASYVSHNAHSEYTAFAGTPAGYNQAAGSANGGQYYKMQQQPVMTSNQNHSTYPNQSSYSNHGSGFSRGSYGSVWK